MQYNYSSLAVEMQLGNPSSNKTFFIVQQGEVSLLRVAYFWKRWFQISFCRAADFSATTQ